MCAGLPSAPVGGEGRALGFVRAEVPRGSHSHPSRDANHASGLDEAPPGLQVGYGGPKSSASRILINLQII
jgi:hypothetical protein